MSSTTLPPIAPPRHAPTDFAYDTHCKEVFEPLLVDLLEKARAAGWEPRKAAYTIMFLASKHVSANKP